MVATSRLQLNYSLPPYKLIIVLGLFFSLILALYVPIYSISGVIADVIYFSSVVPFIWAIYNLITIVFFCRIYKGMGQDMASEIGVSILAGIGSGIGGAIYGTIGYFIGCIIGVIIFSIMIHGIIDREIFQYQQWQNRGCIGERPLNNQRHIIMTHQREIRTKIP